MARTAFKMGVKSAARALLTVASPTSPLKPSPLDRELSLGWLKITVLPLAVFLIGAGIWSCIKNTAAWKTLTEGTDEGNAHTPAVQVELAVSPQPIENSLDVVDVEAGQAGLDS